MTNGRRRLLLGSGGLSTAARSAAWRAAIDEFLGPDDTVLFVPHALKDRDWYVEKLVENDRVAGRRVESLHRAKDPRSAKAAIRGAKAVFVGGGNTFRLLTSMQALGVLDGLRRR